MTLAKNCAVFAIALLGSGCDRSWEVDGKIVVAKGAGSAVAPAVVCVGKGGPPESGGLYGHPAYGDGLPLATLFCGEVPAEAEFSFHESILSGPMPERVHIYAWLEPVPSAKSLCTEPQMILHVDEAELDQMMSPDDAKKPRDQRAPISYPCGRMPRPGTPMTYVVTFDPAHPTWSKSNGRVTEKRDLRIE